MPGNETPDNNNSSDSDSTCQFQVSKGYSDQESNSEFEPELENPKKRKKQSLKNNEKISSGKLEKNTKVQRRGCDSLQCLKSESDKKQSKHRRRE